MDSPRNSLLKLITTNSYIMTKLLWTVMFVFFSVIAVVAENKVTKRLLLLLSLL